MPAGGAGSRGGGGRPPGRPKSGGAACLDAQRPAILEKVAPASFTERVAPSGLSVDTEGMSRVAGAGVGAADDGATGRASFIRGESVMAPLLWRFARGESVMAVGGGGSGAMIFRCDGDGGLSAIADAMVACDCTFGRVWPAITKRGPS